MIVNGKDYAVETPCDKGKNKDCGHCDVKECPMDIDKTAP
jgi:hypothetical protein